MPLGYLLPYCGSCTDAKSMKARVKRQHAYSATLKGKEDGRQKEVRILNTQKTQVRQRLDWKVELFEKNTKKKSMPDTIPLRNRDVTETQVCGCKCVGSFVLIGCLSKGFNTLL